MKSHFTDRIAGRTAMARELLAPARAQLIQSEGLVPEDLITIQTQGEEAEKQDRLQREDLAAQKFSMDVLSKARDQVDQESDDLRTRLPAVHLDLDKNSATAQVASWLATASFERFRLRLVPTKPEESGAPAAPTKPERQRVSRTDRLSRALSASQFATALLSPERAPIVDALAARNFPRTRVEALAKSAKDLADNLGGKITLSASSHTELEAVAVAAQNERWQACRRMIAKIAKSDPELAALWAAC